MTIQLTKYKYSPITNDADATQFPLMYGIVGLNNKIYVSLGSYGFTEGDDTYKELLGQFSPHELRFGCLVRLFEVHLVVRTYDADEEWETLVLDFKDVYAKVKELSNQITDFKVDLHMSLHEDDGVLTIPLGSQVFKTAANYAYQEIERFKMDNFLSMAETKELSQLISIL